MVEQELPGSSLAAMPSHKAEVQDGALIITREPVLGTILAVDLLRLGLTARAVGTRTKRASDANALSAKISRP